MFKIAQGWLAAVLTGTAVGSLVQTQLNLAAIARIHAPVGLRDRVSTSLFDLAGFGPTWGLIIALGFLIAFLVAGGLGRRWPARRAVFFPLAGFVAVLSALLLMDAMLPVTVVSAARSLPGLMLMCLAGALGGWVYLQLVPQRQNGPN